MRSPVAVGIVLGVVVGAGAVAAIAATSWDERATSSPQPTVPVRYRTPVDPAPGSIERLAAAFGMNGPVEIDAGGWVLRDGDRVLRIQGRPGLPWFFSTMDQSCNLVPEGPPSSDALQTVPPSGPTECPDNAPSSDVVSKEDALAVGMETLTRAGLRASTPEIVDEPGGWYIQVASQDNGEPIAELPWTISIGPGRAITAASGYLAVENR